MVSSSLAKKESTAVKLKASDYVGLPKESTAVNLKAVPTESGCLKMVRIIWKLRAQNFHFWRRILAFLVELTATVSL